MISSRSRLRDIGAGGSKMVIGKGSTSGCLDEGDVRQLMLEGLRQVDVHNKRVLVIMPDSTRTAPLDIFFRQFHQALNDPATAEEQNRVAKLDFLVALGTHQPLSEEHLNQLFGITAEERNGKYATIGLHNHAWDDPAALINLGTIPAGEIGELTGGLMSQDVAVTINRLIFDYDVLIVCGPTFPHEVVGFSGGNKYFFPGISGPEVINFTHWLGAVITSYKVIGSSYTPVRAVIDRAASLIQRPKLCFSMVVHGGANLAGLYVGAPEEAYKAAAALSAQLHVVWVEKPYRRVLSVMPHMYDDIWTAAKGMYKLEPAIEDGGEVVIYAPHISEISYTHGKLLDEIGYHCRDYFLKQWPKYSHIPGGVLAHSTHLRGMGTYDATTGTENLRIKVTLATSIPRERCEMLNLGYLDPASIDIESWANREDEGILLVRKAGEQLYRLNSQRAA
jgi:lactate racemase